MSDDQGIILFMAAGVGVLAVIAVVGIVSSRRRRSRGVTPWTASIDHLGDQPYLVSTDVELGDTRSWAAFQERYPVGARVTIGVPGPDEAPRALHVASRARSLRGGWPTAKAGFTAYFSEYDGVEFPLSYRVRGSRRVTAVEVDAGGVVARDGDGREIWSSPWSSLVFSNGNDLIMKGEHGTVRIDGAPEQDGIPLEEIVIKYGTFVQMHF